MSDLNVYTTSQINALTPVTGDLVVDSDLNAVKLWNGTAWKAFTTDGVSTPYQNRWGASFDGSSDYLNIGSKYDFIQQTSTFSISFWVKFTNHTSTTAIQGLLSTNYTSSLKGLYVFYDNRSGNKALKVQNSASSPVTLAVNNGITDNDWHHIGVTSLSGGNFKLYKDGSEIGSLSAPATTTASANNNLRIGRSDVYGGGHYFGGLIDEVAIFNTELSGAQINEIYNSGTPNDIDALNPRSWWRMGDDSNDSPVAAGNITTITDSSGNGNHATQSTASNQPTFKALEQSTTSLSFDGAADYLELNIPAGTLSADFTMAGWVKAPLTQDGPVFYNNYNAASGVGWRMWKDSAGKLNLWASQNATNYHHAFTSNSVVVPDSEWTHLALVRSSGNYKVYKNGAEITLTLDEHTSFLSDSSDLGAGNVIGLFEPHSSNGMSGYADEVAIFNTALSTSDLTSLASSRGAHIVNDLSLSPTGYWRMGEDDSLTDGASVSQITDASGNGLHATQSTAANQPTASVDPVIYV